MVFADGKLTVSAKSDEQEISATVDTLNTQGEPGRTALDHHYLLDYLSGKQGIIVFSQYDKTGPLAFEYQKSPKVLIMPMQVQWPDETPPAAEETEPEPETTDENLADELEEEIETDERDHALDAEKDAAIAEQEAKEEEASPLKQRALEEEPVSKIPARKARKTVNT